MQEPTPATTGFEKWKAGIDAAAGDDRWDAYDCEVQAAVTEFNHHLGGTSGYNSLDWHLIKAVLWTESGAAHSAWRTKPMQIGVPGDPGLSSVLSSSEGSELILPKAWRYRLTRASVTSMPAHNIRAGIAYLLMRMADFEHRSVISATDSSVHEVTVKPGDSLDKIAKAQGTTVEVLLRLNPSAAGIIKPGTVLNFQKASIQRVITGWRAITTTSVAQRYNGGGDPSYAKKLDYALAAVRKGKVAACPR